ncbi:unnamed protein product [Arabis nemorensis]|uniref:Uncharacterized protein n=1 Tax=Arabis nemorensis TaxID=586526 RepID=A0A565C7C4_9BRAS|nr:unnamed protein product [Arabis nemorensis]
MYSLSLVPRQPLSVCMASGLTRPICARKRTPFAGMLPHRRDPSLRPLPLPLPGMVSFEPLALLPSAPSSAPPSCDGEMTEIPQARPSPPPNTPDPPDPSPSPPRSLSLSTLHHRTTPDLGGSYDASMAATQATTIFITADYQFQPAPPPAMVLPLANTLWPLLLLPAQPF